MKMFWKLLGVTALAVGLTPYRVDKNEETGEKKYRALLWQATRTPQGDGENDTLDVVIGLNLPGGGEDEPHLFSDELCVEYTGAPVTDAAPAGAEEAAEPAAPETPEEENKEEA